MTIANAACSYIHPATFSINRPSGSNDYMLLVLKTPAYFILNGQRQLAPAHSLIIFKKGTPQHYGAVGQEFANDWIHFDMDEQNEQRFSQLGIPFDTILPLGSSAVFSEFIKSIFCERYSNNAHKDESMALYFELLLLKLAEKLRADSPRRESPYWNVLSDLRNEIQLSPQKEWTVEQLSQRANLSRSYLQHLYKEFFGVSILTDLLYHRIEHAKYLLLSTDLSVAGVSRSCGYANDVHFMRSFKKATGVTPSKYRQDHLISRREVDASKEQNPFCLN